MWKKINKSQIILAYKEDLAIYEVLCTATSYVNVKNINLPTEIVIDVQFPPICQKLLKLSNLGSLLTHLFIKTS